MSIYAFMEIADIDLNTHLENIQNQMRDKGFTMFAVMNYCRNTKKYSIVLSAIEGVKNGSKSTK